MVYPKKIISAFDPTVEVNFDSSKIYSFMKLPFVFTWINSLSRLKVRASPESRLINLLTSNCPPLDYKSEHRH